MKKLRRKIFLFLENISLLKLLVIFIVTVIIFGSTYYLFSPGLNGIKSTNSEEINFWNALYFSVVTITSLGYGDMQPNGFSKLFCAAEVLFGLALMGMLIAKLTSTRLSYHVKRLYISDSHRQLYRYTNHIRNTAIDINKIIQIFSPKFSEIPTKGRDKKSTENFRVILERSRRSFSNNFLLLSKTLSDFKSYIELEVKHGDFFSEISLEVIKEKGNTFYELLNQVNQFLMGISENKRYNLLIGETGKNFHKILELILEICNIIQDNSKDNNVNLIFTNVYNTCQIINNNIVIVSVPIYDMELPDQITDESKDPHIN